MTSAFHLRIDCSEPLSYRAACAFERSRDRIQSTIRVFTSGENTAGRAIPTAAWPAHPEVLRVLHHRPRDASADARHEAAREPGDDVTPGYPPATWRAMRHAG